MYPESSRLFIQDVQLEYQGLRLRGETREEAVRSLREIFAEPLEDPDDGPCIAVGIALALCKKKELTHAFSVFEPDLKESDETIKAISDYFMSLSATQHGGTYELR